jgi:FkbM family methyltransferase
MRRPLSAQVEPIHYLKEWKPRGVIHVGANDGEEFVYYKSMGIENLCGFEPLKKPFRVFQQDHPDVLKFQLGWGLAGGKYGINVTENDKASSILKTVPTDNWEEHPVFKDWNMGQWPVVGREIIEVVKYADFMKGEPYNPEDYNFLNMDIQGMELEALKGMGKQLDYFDALVIECSEQPVYVGEASAHEVEDYLTSQGFVRCSPVKLHNDILFLRKDKLDG